MKVLNVGCGERFMVKALNVDPNMHKEDVPKGIRMAWAWIGAKRDRFKEKGFDLIFFSYSLRYNSNMPDVAKRLKEIASKEVIIEIIDYIEDPYEEKNKAMSFEWYEKTYIKPLKDVGFKVMDSFEGRDPDLHAVFFRLCTCSRKDVQY